jgi:hypothetical protein
MGSEREGGNMRILVLTAVCILAGCGSAPRSAESTTAKAADDATPVAAKAVDGAQGFKPPPGYKAKIKEWDVVYCKKTPVLGSRFPQEICMTEAQLKDHLAAMETMKRDKDQISSLCTSKPGCAWD